MIDDTPRVLFVDDDRNVLTSMRRALYGLDTAWKAEYFNGGAAALDRLAAGPVAGIVCDLKMPDVDGVTVLSETAKRHPEAIRILLTGDTGGAEARGCGIPAHRIMAKPCDIDALIGIFKVLR